MRFNTIKIDSVKPHGLTICLHKKERGHPYIYIYVQYYKGLTNLNL